MGSIMIRCPQSGREIPTGIEMDVAEFRRAPVFFSRVQSRFAIKSTNGSPRTPGCATARTRRCRRRNSLDRFGVIAEATGRR